jgi:hypothetical protein
MQTQLYYLSPENGKRTSRSEGSSFTKTDRNMRVSYLMIGLMARESTHFQTEKSTRETIKMGKGRGLASTLTLVGANMMAAGKRVRAME